MILHHSMRHIKVARNLRNRQAVMLKKKLEDLNGVIGQLVLWASAIKLLFKVFYLLSKLRVLRLQNRFLMFQRRNLLPQQRDLLLQDGEVNQIPSGSSKPIISSKSQT